MGGQLLERQPSGHELTRITTDSKDEEETKSPHADASPNRYETVNFRNPNFRTDGDDATAQDDEEEIEKTAL